MMAAVRFYRGVFNQAACDIAGDERMIDLGTWLTSDIENYVSDCLETLACIEDVRSGRSTLEQWTGNSREAHFDPSGVVITPLLPGAVGRHYSLDEVHEAAMTYLDFLAPTAEQKARAVTTWEQEFGRTHPCRDHLALG